MASGSRQLIVFLRAPALGRVKRRLARGIGDLAALRFYRECSALVLAVAQDRRWRTTLAVTPDRARLPRDWRAPARIEQGRGDLGRRMMHALASVPPGPVLLIGSDLPELRPAHIARAFAALGTHDVVFGPARDGGYWLIGFARRPLPRGLFARVRWSGKHALADTRASLPKCRRVALVDELRDVDDAESYRLIRRRRDAR